MKKLVVTGGAGFIGSALVRELVRRNQAKIIVLDNLSTGKTSNLDEVQGQFHFEEVDIRDYQTLLSFVQDADVVFHQAAIPSVPLSISDPVPSHDVNLNGTFNLLRACSRAGVRRVVYAGSSSAYGNDPVLPKAETMPPTPQSPYALQKLTGEYYASIFSVFFGLEAISLRYFNVYGPRQDPSSPYSGVLSIFCKAILARKPPTIFGDGLTSRDFIYVDDIVQLNLRAAEAPSTLTGRVFNGGTGKSVTLNETWEVLQRIENLKIQPVYAPPRAGDIRHSVADMTASRRDLKFDTRITLENGLKRTLEWFRAKD